MNTIETSSTVKHDICKSDEEMFNTPYHAMLAEAIHQANQVEFLIDDIIAADYLRLNKHVSSLEAYFDYIRKELQGRTLSHKCKRLFEVSGVLQIFEVSCIKVESANLLFAEWRKLRNILTHGLIVWNSSCNPVLYHKGYCYDISTHVNKFFQLNGQVIAITDALEELKSDYSGKPLILDNCDPDHPIYADYSEEMPVQSYGVKLTP